MKSAKDWAKIYANEKWQQENYYVGDDLGAQCKIGLTTINLWSPVADEVTVNFFKDGNPDTRPYWTSPMRRDKCGVWRWSLPENMHGTYYDFTLVIDGEKHFAVDPYAKSVGVNGKRGLLIDMSLVRPDGWSEDIAPARTNETVIDEIHLKEFSYDPAGGFPENERGKYLALTHADTVLNGAGQTPTGLNYLKSIGITHVQLMPIYDYGSVNELDKDQHEFNWGYDPVNYNSPEGSYSSDASDGMARVKELRAAIMGLHRAGFRVIMDVVYNHTYNLDNGLQNTMPYYYYRTTPDGYLSNGSGCGNDIASERSMVQKYIVDSVLYWTRMYHMDGFRFDLMGLITVDTMNEIRRRLDNKYGKGEKLVYGEPWTAGQTTLMLDKPLADKSNMGLLDDGIGIFEDDTRDSIKGSAGDTGGLGFVNGADGIEWKIQNSVKAWRNDGSPFKSPACVINYVSAHDNQTLWDKLTATTPDEDTCRRQYRLSVGIYLTCQGRPFMLSGESFYRTKGGNGNSHDAPIEINELRWEDAANKGCEDLANFYRGLIALRQQLPGLCDKGGFAHTRIGNQWSQPGVVGFMVDNTDDEQPSLWKFLTIVYNRKNEPFEFELAEGEWQVLATSADTYLWRHPETVSGQYELGPIDFVILGQK